MVVTEDEVDAAINLPPTSAWHALVVTTNDLLTYCKAVGEGSRNGAGVARVLWDIRMGAMHAGWVKAYQQLHCLSYKV